jgi:hypothetical protein
LRERKFELWSLPKDFQTDHISKKTYLNENAFFASMSFRTIKHKIDDG